MTRPIPDFLPGFIKKVEGVKTRAYVDSAGVHTIGVGHTGPEVHPGLVWSMQRVNAALLDDLKEAASRLATVVNDKQLRGLTDHQYGALLSFVFNLGVNPNWTIWKVINAGQRAGVPMQLLRFTKARVNGKLVEVQGLVHRRMAEVALWKTEDHAGAVTIAVAGVEEAPSSGYTRSIETPPEPMPTKPLSRSKSFIASCVTACMTGAGAVATWIEPFLEPVGKGAKKAVDTLQPFAGQSEVVDHARVSFVTIAAFIAIAGVFLLWLKDHKAKVE